MNYSQFTAFRLPEELLNQIDKVCRENGFSRSKLFRLALEKFLKEL